MHKGSAFRVANGLSDLAHLVAIDAQEMNIATFQHLFDHNSFSRLSFLRKHKPVCPIAGGAILLTRREDVLAVLSEETKFVTTYSEKLPGPFVLGVEGTAHTQQRATLTLALAMTTRQPEINSNVTRAATRSVEKGRFAGHLDLGADLVHPVLAQVLENFLGLPQPGQGNLWFWARDIFEDIFLNLTNLPAIHDRAVVASAQLSQHVRAVMARPIAPDTVLDRLVAASNTPDGSWLAEDDAIVFTVIGLAIGWLWHGARAALIAVDELLDNPNALALAHQAARARDHAGLAGVLWEVLRFRPVQPFLVRKAVGPTVVAPGTDRETFVPMGTEILAGTHSAMWDEADIPCPAHFDASRADSEYTIFGWGAHRCLGEEIIRIQLPAMLAPLLAAGDLARGGRLRWDGPRPDDLRVVFRQ